MAELVEVFSDDTYQLTGVAVSAEGRVFTNYPSLSQDGAELYISTSQIHKQPEYNAGLNKRTSPYKIFKLRIS